MHIKVDHGYFYYSSARNRSGTNNYKAKEYLLNDINFSLEQGEILSILGSNGAGKTTLLRNLLGLVPWAKGQSLFDGKTVEEWNRRDFWQKISYVPQAKSLSFSYAVEDMVLLGRNAHLSLFQQPSEADRATALAAIDMVGISHLVGRKCNHISGGELQMVLIARALCAHPEVLVLDEPESNLDFRNQLLIMETIQKLNHEEGITIILNTHYPEHALRISDKTILLGKDRQSYFGKTQEVLTETNLCKIFCVDVRIRSVEIDGIKTDMVIPLSKQRSLT